MGKTSQIISYQLGNNLYLSITDRCTLVCEFCPKTQGTMQVSGYDLTFDHRPKVKEVIAAIDDPARYEQIVFCGYGEPTLRLKVLLEVAAWLKEHGAAKVRVNTDGLANLVHKRNVLPQMQGLVDSLSVSMNAQNEEVYNRHCQPQLVGSYQAMLDFLTLAPKYVPEVVASALDGLAGVDIATCKQIASKLGVGFRARKLGIVG